MHLLANKSWKSSLGAFGDSNANLPLLKQALVPTEETWAVKCRRMSSPPLYFGRILNAS